MPVISTSDVLVPYRTVRSEINRLLEAYFNDRLGAAEQLHNRYGRLWRVLLDAHKAGGKRLRPYLTVLSYQAFGGASSVFALPAAASIELLHGGLLVHDDIIDRDFVRHGRPNVAGHYQQFYAGKTREANHFAYSAALLAGDLLITGAYRLMRSDDYGPELQVKLESLLDDAIFTTAGGELLDTESALETAESGDPLLIARLKTAGYSFQLPLLAGSWLAGQAGNAIDAQLRQLGDHVGVAFQLADDLLGLYGDPDQTGKSLLGDLREGKRTYLVAQAQALATPSQNEVLQSCLGQPEAPLETCRQAAAVIEQCGARAATEAVMRDHAGQAKAIIAGLPMASEAARAEMVRLIGKTIRRSH